MLDKAKNPFFLAASTLAITERCGPLSFIELLGEYDRAEIDVELKSIRQSLAKLSNLGWIKSIGRQKREGLCSVSTYDVTTFGKRVTRRHQVAVTAAFSKLEGNIGTLLKNPIKDPTRLPALILRMLWDEGVLTLAQMHEWHQDHYAERVFRPTIAAFRAGVESLLHSNHVKKVGKQKTLTRGRPADRFSLSHVGRWTAARNNYLARRFFGLKLHA